MNSIKQKLCDFYNRFYDWKMFVLDDLYRLCHRQLRILSKENTLDLVLERRMSLSRFGDGELKIIDGGSIGFQKADARLAERLRLILQSPPNGDSLLVCMTDIFGPLRQGAAYNYYRHLLPTCRKRWYTYLNFDYSYGCADITRFATSCNVQYSAVAEWVDKLKSIWADRRILIIEGSQSRLGVGNDLFDNVKDIGRLLAPPVNSFDAYDELLAASRMHAPKYDLAILALGPTASVLAADLASDGIWALDLGHIDIQYECFKRGYTKVQKIPGKFTNEGPDPFNVSECKDEHYLRQILARVMSEKHVTSDL